MATRFKFYRLATFVEGGNSGGYQFFTNLKAAETAKRENDAEDPNETPGAIDTIHVTPTKQGILDALNRFGGHPDNG